MPISITCAECSSSYLVEDGAAGKLIKCTRCGAEVAVPAADESAQASDENDQGGKALQIVRWITEKAIAGIPPMKLCR